MRKYILITLYSLIAFTGFTQKYKYQYVGIELSPNSVNMSVLNIYSKGDGEFYYKIIKDSSVNIPFIDFTQKSMDDAKKQINSFFQYAVSKRIPEVNISVVVNSGVAIEAKRKNKEDALTNFLFETSSRINPISSMDAKTEAEYSYLSSIVEKFRKGAIMLNIDGANTKGGLYADKNHLEFSPFNINWGFNSLKNAITDENSIIEYNKKIETSLNAIESEIKNEFNEHQLIENQPYCIIGGDLSWAISTLKSADNDGDNLYQEITPVEIKEMKNNIINNYDKFLFSGRAKTLDGQKELEKLKEKYDQKSLLVSINYLERLINILNNMEVQKRFYLVRYNSTLACHVINTFF